jgi:hypothetical protein
MICIFPKQIKAIHALKEWNQNFKGRKFYLSLIKSETSNGLWS